MGPGGDGTKKARLELTAGIKRMKWNGFRLFDMEVKEPDEILIQTHNITKLAT